MPKSCKSLWFSSVLRLLRESAVKSLPPLPDEALDLLSAMPGHRCCRCWCARSLRRALITGAGRGVRCRSAPGEIKSSLAPSSPPSWDRRRKWDQPSLPRHRRLPGSSSCSPGDDWRRERASLCSLMRRRLAHRSRCGAWGAGRVRRAGIQVIPSAFIAAVIGSAKKIGSTRSTTSPETSRKFRLFSRGISARRAPLSMPTWSGSARDFTALMFPWMLRSPRIIRPGWTECLLTRRVDGDDQGDPRFAGDTVAQQVDRFDVEVGRVHLLSDAHLPLLALEVGERPVDRLPHRPFDAPCDLQLARSRRATDLQAIEPDLALVVHRSGIDRARSQRVGRDHLPAALLGDADEPLFSGLVVDVARRRSGGTQTTPSS